MHSKLTKIKNFVNKINSFFSLIKFSHTIFALPFALTGFFLAIYKFNFVFSFKILIFVILSMIFARTSAMLFNRYIDRTIDAKNPRTASREIPKGIIKAKTALILTILNSIAFIITTFFINKLCFFLSPIALFVILGYSYTKRFTAFSHLILGLALSLSPIGAFLAVSGKFELSPVILSLSVLFWVAGFDIIYAIQDLNFDKKNNLKSIPVLLGVKKSLILSSIFHFITSILLFIFGYMNNFHFLYWIGFLIFIFFLIYQHIIVSEKDMSKVNIAFFTSNGIASIIFAFFIIFAMI